MLVDFDLCAEVIREGSCAMHTPTLYAIFYDMHLEYGPDFRTIAECWNGEGGVGHLQRRRQRQGVHIHPGDLDGALQLFEVISSAARFDLHMPFSVEHSTLQAARGGFWTVRKLPVAPILHVQDSKILPLHTGGGVC